MAKTVVRKLAKIFGINSPTDRMAVVGSLRAGAPAYSKDPAVLQGLANFEDGWPGIAIGNSSPPLEDMNSVQFVNSYQLYYLFQEGVAEYLSTATYHTDSIVKANSTLFISLADDNTNNPLTDNTKWAVYGSKVKKITAQATYAVLASDSMLLINAAAAPGALTTVTLPNVSTVPLGKTYTIKNSSPLLSSGTVKVQGTAGQAVEFNASIDLASGPPVNESITVINNGVDWYAI